MLKSLSVRLVTEHGRKVAANDPFDLLQKRELGGRVIFLSFK